MDQRQLASVLFAAVGVFIAVSRLPEIFFHLTLLTQWNPAIEDPTEPFSQRLLSIFALATSLLAVLLGSGLLLLRHRLAEHLFPAEAQPLNARGTQAVALSVLGCYFAIQGVSRIIWPGQLDWGAVTQAVLGVALFFGARGLAGLWSSSRSVGRSRDGGERRPTRRSADVAQRVPIDLGSLLALKLGESPAVGGLCHAAERPVR